MKKINSGINVSLLIAAVIFSAMNTAYAAKVSKPQKESARIDKTLEMDVVSAAPAASIYKRKVFKYDGDMFRDPFANPFTPVKDEVKESVAKEIKLPVLNVQGLMWGANYPSAIINDKVVKVGDVIEGATIIDINSKQVLVKYQEKSFQLPAPALEVKDDKKKSKGGKR